MAPLLDTPIVSLTTLPVQPDSPITPLEETPIVLVSNNVILPNRIQTAGTIVISPTTGKIINVLPEIVPAERFPPGTEYTDYSPKFLMPGLVDAHVHLNEPGWRTEWEGFDTGTKAAAFGGVTTVIDMPLNAIPPTTTIENFNEKLKAADNACWVDVGFYGGVIPGNEEELLPLVKAGVRGFKCFLIESGVDEFPCVTSEDVAKAMEKLKDSSTVLMFHAEMIPPIAASVGDAVLHSEPPAAPTGPLNAYQTFLESRPQSFETYAIEQILALAPYAPDLQLHVVHLSAGEGVDLVKKAHANGIKLSAETCFHYLTLAAEDIEDGDTRHKCCPPIREGSNREFLWDALKDGTITTVVSDHSPCTPDLKMLPNNGGSGDFFEAWGGVSTVGLGLSVLYTEGRKRGVDLPTMAEWTSYNTAKQVGLLGQKGALADGYDADICVFDPEATFTVTTADMHFKNKVTPYEGKELHGRVCETWLRGKRIYSAETGFEKGGPMGELLLAKN
ncbi:hypothetical protein FPQ18DRAFT_159119 [Pyronema domesticum]|uniref:allantoinase n=1 Tax=Pyronema omphalodes (strain CBS 100304) TaxID=1076935 RepID=U4L938_PYROM|nr:hypothetical protein FPQ18DRAFT_159119 [Pyronema domesticum]CCX06639.1 Similar to Allantoinase; acc. no. P32375 [Pyronema omphalodes CBS 100304]